jgi:hypothetical protein
MLQLSFGEPQQMLKHAIASRNMLQLSFASQSEPQHVAAKFCEPKRAATRCSELRQAIASRNTLQRALARHSEPQHVAACPLNAASCKMMKSYKKNSKGHLADFR